MKTLQITMMCAALVAASTVCAQGGRETFLLQQTQAEMQRVSGQVDMMQNNFEDIQRRLSRLEGGGDTRSMKAEIDALKAEVAALRRELAAQRGQIVKDLSGRIAKMQPPSPPPAPKKQQVVIGPHLEYTVQPGDTLSLIAKAFDTTVPKIREMNNLKGQTLRVGQKINVPKK